MFQIININDSKVEMASDEELIQMALDAGFNLWKYEV